MSLPAFLAVSIVSNKVLFTEENLCLLFLLFDSDIECE